MVNGEGRILRFDYDELGRLVNKHAPGKLLARYFYDTEGPSNPNVTLTESVAWYDWGLNATHSFTLPSWSSVQTVASFTVDTANSSVKAAATLADYVGTVSHRVVDSIDEPLLLSVTFRDNPAATSTFSFATSTRLSSSTTLPAIS